jgi:hypothetical protein
MKFDMKETKLGIFFNERVAVNEKYTFKKSKTKNIELAIYKDRIIGMQLDTRKVVDYNKITNFLTKEMKIDKDETDAIMSEIVGLSVFPKRKLSDTIH